MTNFEKLHELQQEHSRLLKLHPHAKICAEIYENMGTPIDEIELEIERLNKLIEKIKIELDSFNIDY